MPTRREGHGGVSVVVATRDRPALLDSCLTSLCESAGPDDEIIVVNSGPANPHVAALAKAHGVRLIQCTSPGASRARNVGWRAASHELIAFIDDDVRVESGWTDALRGTFCNHPETAFVTGRLGLSEHDEAAERPVAFFDEADPMIIDAGVVETVGHGANLAVRRQALQEVGGYNESLGPGARWTAAEDLELLDRLLAAGFEGRYEPTAAACHVQWRTVNDLWILEWRYGVGQGARLALLWKLDRARCLAVAKSTTWDWGVVELVVALWRGWEKVAARALLRLAGTFVGAVGIAFTRLLSPRPKMALERRSQ